MLGRWTAIVLVSAQLFEIATDSLSPAVELSNCHLPFFEIWFFCLPFLFFACRLSIIDFLLFAKIESRVYLPVYMDTSVGRSVMS